MILGIGIDILDIRRISGLLARFGSVFEHKFFTDSEIRFCYSRLRRDESFAKIFSIKEAAIKAVSNKRGMKWLTTEVWHDGNGGPNVRLYCEKYGWVPGGGLVMHVSTSDEGDFVTSMAVLEKRDGRESR